MKIPVNKQNRAEELNAKNEKRIDLLNSAERAEVAVAKAESGEFQHSAEKVANLSSRAQWMRLEADGLKTYLECCGCTDIE